MRHFLHGSLLLAVVLVSSGCTPADEHRPGGPGTSADGGPEQTPDGGPEQTPDGGPEETGGCTPTPLLPTDEAAADRGREQLLEVAHGTGVFPRLGLGNLWVVWGGGKPADYWGAFRARYGLYPAPYPNDGYPMGIRAVDASLATLDCMICHGGKVAGQSFVGAPNAEVDLQLLLEDLSKAAELAGQPSPTYKQDLTLARGANDAMGLGLWLARRQYPAPPDLNESLGYQDPPAWWTLKYKSRMYLDGAGDSRSIRNTMAFLLAFGLPAAQVEAKEPAFRDIHAYLVTLEPPKWPGAVDEAKAAQGRALFQATCSRCHGDYVCGTYPNHVEPVEAVGTDPARAAHYRKLEVDFVNSGWFGKDYPQTSTGGYLAPNLRGIWASAPYFHNGSAPTLQDVLSSSQRPKFFRRLGSDPAHYDEVKVGWKVEVLATGQNPAEPRATRSRVYDTTLPGLSNAGHTYGDALAEEERAAVIEYLKTL